ncbi:MAG: type IV secretory system conjugative DNA transfer family protein [Alphaproteobacteria bacterium]
MAAHQNTKGSRFIPACLLAGVSWYALDHTGPLQTGNGINLVTAGIWGLLIISGSVVLGDCLKAASQISEWFAANTPKRLKGTSDWVKSLSEVRRDLIQHDWGPFWGAFEERYFLVFRRRKEVIADHESNALVVGTSGSGKGVTDLQVNAMTIRESKVILCFKGENTCVLAGPLRERGEDVRVINLGDLFPDIIGESDTYNILIPIAENFERPGGLLDVFDDVFELNMQLLPEPKGEGGGNDDGYFRQGSREMIGFTVVFCVLIFGDVAALGDVAHELSDRDTLLKNAQWASGKLNTASDDVAHRKMPLENAPWAKRHDPEDVKNFIEAFRDKASKVAGILDNKESKTAESFLTGAQQALERFSKGTRAHKKLASSTFRFSQLKEGKKPTTVFIVIDASRIAAQTPAVSLTMWGMLTELKRHPDKHSPVYILADEITNFKIQGLISGLTWFRGFGIRMRLYLQNFPAFREAYSEAALKTLQSECECQIFLPGLRDPETIKFVKDKLAERAVISRGRRGSRAKGFFNIESIDYRESEVPLMTEDEIRRTDKAIFFLRKNKPMLLEPIKIAEIAPFRKQIDINPFHGKPFLLPVKLHLKRGSLLKVLMRRVVSWLQFGKGASK